MKVKTVVTGVGAQITALINEGKLSNKEILAKVRADNPMRKTTYACVAWYQSHIKKEKAQGSAELERLAAEAKKAQDDADAYAASELAVLNEQAAEMEAKKAKGKK